MLDGRRTQANNHITLPGAFIIPQTALSKICLAQLLYGKKVKLFLATKEEGKRKRGLWSDDDTEQITKYYKYTVYTCVYSEKNANKKAGSLCWAGVNLGNVTNKPRAAGLHHRHLSTVLNDPRHHISFASVSIKGPSSHLSCHLSQQALWSPPPDALQPNRSAAPPRPADREIKALRFFTRCRRILLCKLEVISLHSLPLFSASSVARYFSWAAGGQRVTCFITRHP